MTEIQNISSALARQTNESINFPMTGTVEFGHDYLEATNSWPTLVILAPNPAQNEGLVNIAHGQEIDIFELFNSKKTRVVYWRICRKSLN